MRTHRKATNKPYHIEARELGVQNLENIKKVTYPRRVSATDLRKIWDYQKAGLKIDQARELVDKWQTKSYHTTPHQPYSGRITTILEVARGKAKRYQEQLADILSLSDGDLSWSHTRIRWEFAGQSIVTVYHQNATWSNKRSYRYPTSTSSWCTSHLLKTTTPGTVEMYKLDTYNILSSITDKVITHDLRGNWRNRAIIDLFGVTPEKQKGLSHIQLDAYYRVAKLRTIAGVEIWRRTLAGETMDYCAVIKKDTYHAKTQREAVKGLAAKLAAPGSRRETIDYDYARSLGFCRAGIEQFCDDNNVDIDGKYSRSDIAKIVRERSDKNKQYENELRKVGITL